MKSRQTRAELKALVVLLTREGMSARAISRREGVSRVTVRKLLTEHAAERGAEADEADAPAPIPKPPERAPRPSLLDDHKPRIDELFARFPDITAQRVYEILGEDGFEGGYTIVKAYVRTVRPRPTTTPSMPATQYGPAEMAENDWSPFDIDFTHAPKQRVEVFSYTLTYSTRKHFVLFESTDLHALMDGHVASFEHFGGAAHACKYDNQKAVVLGWDGSRPIYNPRFLSFSTYYEFRPEACRIRRPNDKPRVERSFWEFERSFLNGRAFRDLADMRAQLAGWEANVADQRPRRHAPRVPRMELFADERPLLRHLPQRPYDTARVVYRLCGVDGYVAWDGNRYAVPLEHITEILPVRITRDELHIYAPDLRRIASHGLAPSSLGEDIGGERYHPRPNPGGRALVDLDMLRQTFDDMGPSARSYLDALCKAQGRVGPYHARRILLLRERFDTDDLRAALEHAAAYGAWEHQAIERILNARFPERRLAEYVNEDLAGRLVDNLRPRPTPKSARQLTDYDRPRPHEGPNEERTCPQPAAPATTPTSSSFDGSSNSSD